MELIISRSKCRLVASLNLINLGENFMTIKDAMELLLITLHVCSYSARILLCSYSSRIKMSKRCHSPVCSGTPSKRVKYVASFKDEWRSTYSWVKRSVKGDGYAFCVVCNVNISISHGGKNDLTKHQKTVTHIASAEAAKSTPKVTSLLASGPDKVTTAETLFCHFIVEHNLPMAVADHFSSLVKQMFPDSEIAKNFACMPSKTTHIINKALAPTADDRVTSV